MLEIGHEHVEEEVKTRILEATKKITGKRKADSKKAEDDDDEDLFGEPENLERLKDWESIDSSDEAKPKKANGGSRAASSKKAAKSKTKAEDKEAAKKANTVILGMARKGLRHLEPASKEAKKAVKCIHCPDDLKEEATALGQILKECKYAVNHHAKATADGKILNDLTMDVDGMKELATNVKSKADSVCAVAKTLSNMDDAALAKLQEAAKRTLEAKNVD